MNILFFSRLFYPYIGGVEKHVLEISKLLIKKGHKVIVVTEQGSFKTKLNEIVEGIEVFRIPSFKDGKLKKFKIWKWLWDNYKLMENADIVHCHDVFFWYLPFRFLLPLKRVFTTFHGYEGYPLKFKNILIHKISERLSLGNICVGDFIKKWYNTKPTYVIYGAVEKKLIKPDLKLVIPGRDIMFLGRLEEETGIMQYLKALKLLRDKKINFKLDVFGDGNLRKSAENFAKENRLKVSFKGFVRNATDFIKDYNYIFVSRYLGILEAIAFKKPIFSQYNNAIKKDYLEMAPFSPFISISKDEAGIAVSVQNFIDNKSKLNVNKAYEWVKDKTWEKIAEIYLDLWTRKK